MTTSTAERAAAGLLGVQGLVLIVVAGWEIVSLVAGDSEDTGSSIALIVLTVVGALAVIGFAIAVARGQSWGRSGGIVTQLLTLAVALGAVTGPTPAPLFACALAVPAIVTFAVLVFAIRAAAARREEDRPAR